MKKEDLLNSPAGKAIFVATNIFWAMVIAVSIFALILGVTVVIMLRAYMDLAELIIISFLILTLAFLIFWSIFKVKIFGMGDKGHRFRK